MNRKFKKKSSKTSNDNLAVSPTTINFVNCQFNNRSFSESLVMEAPASLQQQNTTESGEQNISEQNSTSSPKVAEGILINFNIQRTIHSLQYVHNEDQDFYQSPKPLKVEQILDFDFDKKTLSQNSPIAENTQQQGQQDENSAELEIEQPTQTQQNENNSDSQIPVVDIFGIDGLFNGNKSQNSRNTIK